MPKRAHPMDVVRTAVSLMGLEDRDTSNNSPKANMKKAMRIFAQTPTAVAAFLEREEVKELLNPIQNYHTLKIFLK